jgi:hypothetical protein
MPRVYRESPELPSVLATRRLREAGYTVRVWQTLAPPPRPEERIRAEANGGDICSLAATEEAALVALAEKALGPYPDDLIEIDAWCGVFGIKPGFWRVRLCRPGLCLECEARAIWQGISALLGAMSTV